MSFYLFDTDLVTTYLYLQYSPLNLKQWCAYRKAGEKRRILPMMRTSYSLLFIEQEDVGRNAGTGWEYACPAL